MGCCRGWPARGLNVIDERTWATLNPNFEYDGDESIALFPGYISGDGTSTILTLEPVNNFLPYPHEITAPFPLVLDADVRSLCVAGGNVALMIFTFATTDTFSGDYVVVTFSYQNASGRYWIEIDGLADGVSFNSVIDTGITLAADRIDNIKVVLGPGTVTIYLNGDFFFFKAGLNFPQIGYLDLSIQYTAANRQGMLGRTQIYTQAP